MCHLVLFILAPTVTHPNADQGLHYCQKHSRHCSRAANIREDNSFPPLDRTTCAIIFFCVVVAVCRNDDTALMSALERDRISRTFSNERPIVSATVCIRMPDSIARITLIFT